MKKILFVATVDIHIINFHLHTIHELKSMGNAVDVAASGTYSNADINRKFNVCFSKNPISFNNIKAYFEMKKIVLENKYDVVSCHTPLSSFFTRLAMRKNKDIKVIYTAHGFHFFKGSSLISKLIYKNMEKIAARFTDILVTINQEDFEASQQFKLKKEGKCIYIPGIGVDIQKIHDLQFEKDELRKELNLNKEDYLLLSVGELNDNKNHMFVMETLLQRFKENKNLKYYICGIGPNKEKYEHFISTHGLQSQIKLLGYRKDIYKIHHLADVFIFPSLREGLPVSLIESMAAGAIPIVTNVRGNRDIVTDNETGFIIDVGDKYGLLSSYNKIFKKKINREKMIFNEYKSIKKYDIKNTMKKILELYG